MLACKIDWELKNGGAEGIRTPDPRDANAMLYQLSYNPTKNNLNYIKSCFCLQSKRHCTSVCTCSCLIAIVTHTEIGVQI